MRRAVRAIVFRGNDMLVMKRNKFGREYFTLPGGGIAIGESPEAALRRELSEETSMQLGNFRLVFVEDAGEPYGVQYIFLADYAGGEPQLSPTSDEAEISALGKNLYLPMWLSIHELEGSSFVSERLKQAILSSVKQGFPDKVIDIS